MGFIIFFAVASKEFRGKKTMENIEKPKYLTNFLFINLIKLIYNYILMKTIFLIFLTVYIAYFLFRPVTKKEIEKFNDQNNSSNMGL